MILRGIPRHSITQMAQIAGDLLLSRNLWSKLACLALLKKTARGTTCVDLSLRGGPNAPRQTFPCYGLPS